MGLGRNWENMAHESVDHLINTELWAEREQAAAAMQQTLDYLGSVGEMFQEAQQAGNIPQELFKAYTDAQIANIAAVTWMMNVNRAINQGEQSGKF